VRGAWRISGRPGGERLACRYSPQAGSRIQRLFRARLHRMRHRRSVVDDLQLLNRTLPPACVSGTGFLARRASLQPCRGPDRRPRGNYRPACTPQLHTVISPDMHMHPHLQPGGDSGRGWSTLGCSGQSIRWAP